MLKHLPKDDEYTKYNLYPNRTIYHIQDGFWAEIEDEFKTLFGDRMRLQLCRDFPGYEIGPHTDGGRDLETYLFYLAKDFSHPELGTSLFERPGFHCDGSKHHSFDDFTYIKTIPYFPNTGFHFWRTGKSFHGVRRTNQVRNVLQLNIYR
jgi:hypothetical protein